ncbi:MAG: prepilin-type N-terminal cleavage/methylation domain-containing protein [Thermodesulfobacteriota bacterium]|nr:prepilin-type N-terminal cleavage/methylation domain-containing protein [Thermodesulfobacteriota bacterium]
MAKTNRKNGFTLIELLVILEILGILTAIAIPIYRVETRKAKLTEATNAMCYIASALATYRNQATITGAGTTWPNCGNIAEIQTSLGVGLAALGRVGVASVNQSTGVISVTVANIDTAVDGSTITLTPTTAADSSISWKWGGPSLPDIFPNNSRNIGW